MLHTRHDNIGLESSGDWPYGADMNLHDAYLVNAAAERKAAAATNLPNRRAMHERSAATWETMARSVADTRERAVVNAIAKSAQAQTIKP